MHAYIIIGTNLEKVEENINNIAQKTESTIANYSIKSIESVRELTGFLKLSQPSPLTILIRNIDEATPEASNAFLKNLEEPSKNINFILTSKSEYNVLPTILSRCQIIRVGNKKLTNDNQEGFLNLNFSDKMSVISKIKNRDDAKEFLEQIIVQTHAKLVSETTLQIALAINTIQEALENINANGNVSLQLTNLVVKLENMESSDTMDKD